MMRLSERHIRLIEDGVEFCEGDLVAIITALHQSIVRARPDFGSWPGIPVDPDGPSPWTIRS